MIGPSSQQDVEISALYRDATITYGAGNVLGILSTNGDRHILKKRDAEEVPNTPDTTATTANEPSAAGEERDEDFVFYPSEQSFKILLYTKLPPTLIKANETIVLKDTKTTITTNKRSTSVQTLKVRYNSKARPVSKI